MFVFVLNFLFNFYFLDFVLLKLIINDCMIFVEELYFAKIKLEVRQFQHRDDKLELKLYTLVVSVLWSVSYLDSATSKFSRDLFLTHYIDCRRCTIIILANCCISSPTYALRLFHFLLNLD